MGFWPWSRLASSAWGLREAKSSSGLKGHYLDDIAPQAYVLRAAVLREFM